MELKQSVKYDTCTVHGNIDAQKEHTCIEDFHSQSTCQAKSKWCFHQIRFPSSEKLEEKNIYKIF